MSDWVRVLMCLGEWVWALRGEGVQVRFGDRRRDTLVFVRWKGGWGMVG